MKQICFFAFVSLFCISFFSQQQTLASWYFDGLPASPNTPVVIAAEGGIQQGVATIYLNGTQGSSSWVQATELNSFSGTTLNDDRPTPNASQALALVGNSANGKSFVIVFSTTGKNNIQLSYVVRATSTGFSSHLFEYSVDGINFISIGTITITRDGTFRLYSLDFSSITAMNNQPTVYLRVTVNGATSASGNNRLDNILIKGTPIGGGSIDTIPPLALNAWVVTPRRVKVSFNEAIADTAATNPSHYQGVGSMDSIKLNTSKDTATLFLTQPLANATPYILHISNLRDISNNVMDSIFTFTLFYDTLPPQLVITEIMYNPPESGIDSLEFIEIYNNGPQTIDLKGFTLRYGSINYVFPNHILLSSGSFFLIAPQAAKASNFYGMTFYQGPTNGISNSGTTIKILTPSGQFVDSVRYLPNAPWPTAANGQGYSLSLCNPNLDNNNPANWGLGTNAFGVVNGYTVYADPGQLCTTPPDNTPPTPINAWATNFTTVKVSYNEPIDPVTGTNPANYTGLGTISNIVLNSSKDTATLQLSSPLQNATMYTLTINNIKDLNNNQMTQPVQFIIYLDTNNLIPNIVITEIMYNPPESGIDSLEFIEFYNNGNGVVNLKNFTIKHGSAVHTITQNYFLQPHQYFLYAPKASAASNFYGLNFYQGATTGLSNSGSTIKIFDAQNNLLDSVRYQPSSPWPTQANGGGYSLSLCDPNSDNNDPSSWTLGHQAFGVVNGVTVYADPGQGCPSPIDTVPPVPISAQAVNATTIKVTFNEPVETISATTASNYSGVGAITNVTLDASQTVATLALLTPLTPNVVYYLTVQNISDLAYNIMPQPYILQLIYDTSTTTKKLVITEIMYNPPESGVDSLEFIEIYNNDNASVDLINYVLKYGGAQYTFSQSTVIQPQGFVILAPRKTAVNSFYNVNSIQISNTGLSNSGTFIVLKDNQGRTVDSVYYLPSSPWPTQANGLGRSLTLCDPNADNTLPSNWYVSNQWIGEINGYGVYADPNSLCILQNIEEKDNVNIVVYPNPFSDRIKLISADPVYSIRIISITGKIVFEETSPSHTNSFDISVEHLSRGVYIVSVYTTRGSKHFSLIKQ
ncbi:MAG: lamin tail domain-containing protein [Bacteroidales bacterium]|nr:lamin tail domain-containing protein [Bacteroidales bacterium]